MMRGALPSRPAEDIWLTCREGMPLLLPPRTDELSSEAASIFRRCRLRSHSQTASPISRPMPSAAPTTAPTTLPVLTPPLLLLLEIGVLEPNVESDVGVAVTRIVLVCPSVVMLV